MPAIEARMRPTMSAFKQDPLGSDELEHLRSKLELESSDGLKVLTDPENNPICSISFDNSLPGIIVIWKRYATSTQFRFIHEYILHLLVKHVVSKVLGDDTALATIHTEDRDWIVQDWMPRAMAAGLRAAASKKPDAYHGRYVVTSVQSEVKGVVTGAFDEITDARHWLQSI